MSKINFNSNCYLCPSEKLEYYSQVGIYKLSICPRCELIQTMEVQSDQVQHLYHEINYYSEKGGSGFDVDGFLDKGLNDPQTKYYEKWRWKPLSEALLNKNKVLHLDIGCSAGHFLAIARSHGWEVEGVEASPVACEYAVEKLSLKVHRGFLEDIDFGTKKFDSISLFHVLEHFEDPKMMLLKIRNLLSPQGILAIEIPNARSIPALLRKKSWHGYVLPYHLWHFSRKSVHKLLNQSGFRIVSVVTPYIPYSSSHIFNLHHFLSKSVKQFKKNRNKKSEPIGAVSNSSSQHLVDLKKKWLSILFKWIYWPLDYVMFIIGKGEVLYILAEKESG